jgi:hypothetical protein
MNRREALTTLAVLMPAVTSAAGGKPRTENEKPGPATPVEPPKPGGHSIAPLLVMDMYEHAYAIASSARRRPMRR